MKKALVLLVFICFLFCFMSCSDPNTNTNNTDNTDQTDDIDTQGDNNTQINTININKSWLESRSVASINFPVGMIEDKIYVTYAIKFTVNTSGYDAYHNLSTNITLFGYTQCTYWGDFGTGYTINIPYTIFLYKNNNYGNTNTIYLYKSDFPQGTIAISRVELFINSASGTIVQV